MAVPRTATQPISGEDATPGVSLSLPRYLKSRDRGRESRSSLAREGASKPRNAASGCDAAPHGGLWFSVAVPYPTPKAGAVPGPEAAAAGAAAGEDPRRRGDRRRVRRPRPAPRGCGGVHRAAAERAARGQLVAPRGR